MAWRPVLPVAVAAPAPAAGAGAAVVGVAGAGAAPTGAAPPAMHCLLKSRYFIPLVCFAAFILSHSAAHSFMVLAWAGIGAATGASAAALARAATIIKQRLFMRISCAGRERASRR